MTKFSFQNIKSRFSSLHSSIIEKAPALKRICLIWTVSFVCYGICWNGIPEKYADKTYNTIKDEWYQAWQKDRQEMYDGLMSQYEADHNKFIVDYTKYLDDLEAFNKALKEYEEAYETAMLQYDSDIVAREKAQQDYEKAYNAAYKKAENAAYANGIEFRINAYASKSWNNHVGNDWRYQHLVNGSVYYDISPIHLYSGNGVSCSSTIQEADKVPDTGYGSGYHTVTYNDLKNGFSVNFQIIVRENRGRYSGNTAGFDVSYTFDPITPDIVVDTSTLPTIPDEPVKPEYDPPENNLILPTEPIKPTWGDVDIPEPDYSEIHIDRDIIMEYNTEPWYILTSLALVVFGADSIVAYRLLLPYYKKEDVPADKNIVS